MWRTSARLASCCAAVSIASLLLGIWYAWRRRSGGCDGTVAQERSTGSGSRVSVKRLEPRQVFVVDDPTSSDDMMAMLTGSLSAVDAKVVGMDCEWVTQDAARPVRRPVALLQLSSSGVCLLLRLHKLLTDQGSLPACIEAFLADESVAKVGVAIHEDAAKLKEDYGVTVQGCLDLRHLAGCRVREWSDLGLKGLSSAVLGVELDKGTAVRCSNWEAAELSEAQVRYAAEDAFIALRVHDQLMYLIESASAAAAAEAVVIASPGNLGGTLDKTAAHHQYPAHYGTVEANGFIQQKQWPRPAVDQAAGGRQTPAEPQRSSGGREGRARPGAVASLLPVRGFKHPTYAVRKRPMYDNCMLLDPDGQPLSTCEMKKARWYLDKGIAVLVSDEPLTVRLLHEPRGRSTGQQLRYYTVAKKDVCVVCGSDRSLVRKSIVPHEYRRHFLAKQKDHSSHDILLLCVLCHQQCNWHDTEFRKQLVAMFDTPDRQQQCHNRAEVQNDSRKVASAARALIRARENLPAARRAECEALVRSHLGIDDSHTELTEDLLLQAESNSVYCRVPRSAGKDEDRHGYRVVQRLLQQGKLLEFERQWRQRFVDLMSPRYLPPFWSVDYCHLSNPDDLAVQPTSVPIGDRCVEDPPMHGS